jgi:hypothetical protein
VARIFQNAIIIKGKYQGYYNGKNKGIDRYMVIFRRHWYDWLPPQLREYP